MARKESITKEILLQAACELLKEEGEENMTVRKIAAKANCSTQPIFRVFKGMDDLNETVFMIMAEEFQESAQKAKEYSKLPFVNLGMAYIECAMRSPNIFKYLFLPRKKPPMGMYDILNGKEQRVAMEIRRAKELGAADAGGLFSRLWIFIHGSACMSITGDFDLSMEQTVQMLESAYLAFSGK